MSDQEAEEVLAELAKFRAALEQLRDMCFSCSDKDCNASEIAEAALQEAQ